MTDALLSAKCLRRDPSRRMEEGCGWVLWHGAGWHVFCMLWVIRWAHLCCAVTSVHLQLHCHHVCLHTLTARHSLKNVARCCSAESLKDKWSWVLTMAVILWRGRGAMSLYSANLITDLLFACVSTQCNLKATPGLPGDAKYWHTPKMN